MMTVSASGTDLSYQWEIWTPATKAWKTTTTAGTKTSTITISVTEARNVYRYRCVVTDGSGSKVTTNAATLTVQ